MNIRNAYLPLMALAGLGVVTSPASAADVNCPPNVGAVTIDGNVIVTSACRLDGTIVRGSVLLYSGGSLVARGAHIDGSIQAQRASFVDVENTRIGGSLQLDDLTGSVSRIVTSNVVGSIQLNSNRMLIDVRGNEVGADVQAFSNSGGVQVFDNRIVGNLQCKSNVPAPAGGNNVVRGNAEDQCADFRSAGSGGAPGGGVIPGDVNCPANLGAVTVDGNVLVASACRLDGTYVKGNVLLYSGGSLVARGARIDGSIQAERANFVDVADTRVIGSIQLDELVGDLSRMSASFIDGGIQLKANRSRLEVLANEVRGDVQAFSNTGGVLITDNRIDGNLQCKNNAPAPAGGNNVVRGNREDQCANLQPEAGAVGGGSGLSRSPGGSQSPSGTASASGGGGGATSLWTLLVMLAVFALRPRVAAMARRG